VARSSLDLSDRAVLGLLAELLAAVRAAAGETSLLLIGAAARDLLLVHAHGIDPERATEDTDVALAVDGWDDFQRLREALVRSGQFTADGPPHRLWHGDQRLDIVPFGGVERSDRSIEWPTEGREVMSVKIWAWKDRMYSAPGKDASDIWMFLRHYANAGNEDRLYAEEGEALAAHAFDLDKAGAWLLGRDARAVLAHGPDTLRSLESLDAILSPEIDPDGPLRLVTQMPPGQRDRQLSMLTAFCAGLFEGRLSKA
jgi:predicted nucleotidyltransferase